ncbi:hypothetical protein ERJ75_000089600 [Trypanosoma vivax]|nr:hypothetical protein ERJ75_000089600 [Trypanosoma vivax]
MVCAWRSAVLLLAAALCLGVCPARGAATRTVSDSDPEDGAPQWECRWLSTWLGALRELKSLNKFYVLYFQDIQSVYRAYVTMLSDDEEVRNHKDVLETRAAVQRIVDEVHASGGRLGGLLKNIYDVLVLWHKQFMHDHGPDAGKCKFPRHEGNLSRDAGFADRLDALDDETDELLHVSGQHGVRYYGAYGKRLHELYRLAREEDEFFTLRKQMREATRSVRKAQAAAENRSTSWGQGAGGLRGGEEAERGEGDLSCPEARGGRCCQQGGGAARAGRGAEELQRGTRDTCRRDGHEGHAADGRAGRAGSARSLQRPHAVHTGRQPKRASRPTGLQRGNRGGQGKVRG